MSAFHELFASVPRQGPGLAKDVGWAVAKAGAVGAQRVCDAACGNGGDIAALCETMPEAQICAVDREPVLLAAARARHAENTRITIKQGDISALEAQPEAPFDFIWCAGAIYFLGTVQGLKGFQAAIAPGGAVAFSAPVYFTNDPSPSAQTFWMDVPVPTTHVLHAEVAEAGYEMIADRPLSNAAWRAFYDPLACEIATRRTTAAPDMMKVLDALEIEMAAWSRVKRETGYQLVVARSR